MKALDNLEFWKIRKSLISFSKFKLGNIDYLKDENIMLINAHKDPMHEPAEIQLLADALPNASIVDIEFVDNHEEFGKAIRSFINEKCQAALAE